MTKPWQWTTDGEGGYILRDGRGRNRANVWRNGVWHTWDEEGIGGENDVCQTARDACDQVMAAVVRQGWVAWKVHYFGAKPAP